MIPEEAVYVVAAFLGWFVAQGLKIILSLHKDGLSTYDLIASGGMPSSHSSFVASVTTVIGLSTGFSSAIFGLALTLLAVVVYDATGVRRATGENTQEIREIMKQLKIKNNDQALNIALGHTPLQVLAGLFVGVGVGFLTYQLV